MDPATTKRHKVILIKCRSDAMQDILDNPTQYGITWTGQNRKPYIPLTAATAEPKGVYQLKFIHYMWILQNPNMLMKFIKISSGEVIGTIKGPAVSGVKDKMGTTYFDIKKWD